MYTSTSTVTEGPSGPDAYLLNNFEWTDRTSPGNYTIEFSSDGKRYTLSKPESADTSARAATIEPEGWSEQAEYLCLVMPLRLVD